MSSSSSWLKDNVSASVVAIEKRKACFAISSVCMHTYVQFWSSSSYANAAVDDIAFLGCGFLRGLAC